MFKYANFTSALVHHFQTFTYVKLFSEYMRINCTATNYDNAAYLAVFGVKMQIKITLKIFRLVISAHLE